MNVKGMLELQNFVKLIDKVTGQSALHILFI